MTADARSTRNADSLADRPAGTVSPGHGAALIIEATSDASASCGARVDDVPTPFYDLLTAMIQAQALENELIRQHGSASGHDDPVRAHIAAGGSGRRHGSNASSSTTQNRLRIKVNTALCVANHRWRALTQRQSALIAGLIVTAAVGGGILSLHASMRQSHVVAAVDEPSKEKSPVVGAASATKEPVLRVEEPDGLEKSGVEGERAIERGIGTGNTEAAHSDDPKVAPPVTTQSLENLASDAAKLDVARTINHVNMRAGPSNDQAVVMRIPAGSHVQVVKCRHWCEVIFAGQQGWVYKGFIDTSPMPRRHLTSDPVR